MLSRLWPLIKILFSQTFNLNFRGKKSKASKRGANNTVRNRIMAITLILFILVIFGFSFGSGALAVGALAKEGGFTLQLGSLLALGLSAVVLLFSSSILFTSFFTATDNHVWLPLPFKPWEIFIARLISSLLSIYLFLLMFVGPIIIGYSIGAGSSFFQVVGQLLLFISLPLIPSAIVFLFSTGLSYIVNISKHRKLFQGINMAIMFIGIFAFSMAGSLLGNLASSPVAGGSIDLTALADSINEIFSKFSIFAFIYKLSGPAFYDEGIYSLLLPLGFLAISIAILAITSFIANKTYKRILYSEGFSKRKRGKKVSLNEAFTSEKHYKMMFKRETKTIFRSPTYIFNLVFPQLMLAVTFSVMGVFLLVTTSQSDAEALASIKDIAKSLFDPVNGFYFSVIVTAVAFLNSYNTISSTAFTREGANAGLLKAYPVRVSTIFHAKMTLGTITDSLAGIILLILIAVFAGANPLIVVLYISGIIGISILMNYLSLLFDSRFPNLSWTTELEACKNNKNLLFSMLLSFAVSIGLALTIAIFAVLKAHLLVSSIVLLAIIFGTIVFLEMRIRKLDLKLLDRLG